MTNDQSKDVSNSELLDFIKQNVFMKSDFDTFKSDNFQPMADSLNTLATRVNKILDRDYPAQKKRISRVEFRTEKLLGKQLATTDANFEKKYRGEQQLTKQEAEAQ